MNKKLLIDEIAQTTGSSKKDAKSTLETLLQIFAENLSKGEGINLIGFGNFKVVEKKARVGINPKTGEKVNIPAKKVVKFKVGKELHEGLNQ